MTDTSMLIKEMWDNAMDVGYVIFKLSSMKTPATFENIIKEPLLKDKTREQVKKALEALDYTGHINFHDSTFIADKYIRVFGLNYPDCFEGYAKLKGWIETPAPKFLI